MEPKQTEMKSAVHIAYGDIFPLSLGHRILLLLLLPEVLLPSLSVRPNMLDFHLSLTVLGNSSRITAISSVLFGLAPILRVYLTAV